MGERVALLSERTQQLLWESSVLGQTFPFDDLARIENHEDLAIEQGLEEVLRVFSPPVLRTISVYRLYSDSNACAACLAARSQLGVILRHTGLRQWRPDGAG